ncbi:uncharacterized protein LOC127809435 [Diospyros lotus]|uniref:uncharacterized protein LOC127809435 n=1 Tax=Diospyros lotus TaxID=55363 RepID=UPI002258FFE6|nr:uncharacterized protein LOC127809435 [Diospyros lotus]
MSSCVYCGCRPMISVKLVEKSSGFVVPQRGLATGGALMNQRRSRVLRASMVESSSNFIKRMETAWLISQQPRPIVCTTCDSNGHVECKWCGGTGFFILGDNMLCQVPSRNTSCVICAGKGTTCCVDCKGTGYRARWLEQPPIPRR